MSASKALGDRVDVAVENVGGIDKTEISFTPGVTILAGRNTTNRTSLLQGLMAGLGSKNVSIKGDADEARVELTVGDTTYTRTLNRTNGDVHVQGEAYLDNSELADLFVFLLESNEARRAVETASDLREIIMRPVDTQAIEAEIEKLQSERDDIERQLENLRSMRTRLPELEQRRQDLLDEIETKEADLEEAKEAIEEADREVAATRDDRAKLEETLETFRDARSELEDVRYNIETERESITALKSEVENLESGLEDLPELSNDDLDEVEAQIDTLRSRRETLDETVNDLQKVIQFNEEMLDGTNSEIATALRDENEENVTTRLVDDQAVCWTCGSDVDNNSIEETLDRLRALRQEKLQERCDLQSELDELKTEKATHQERKRQRSQIQTQLDRAQNELEQRRERVAELTDERDQLEARIENLESEIESLQDETQSELLDSHREANQIEFELGQLQKDLENVTTEIESLKSELDRRDELEAQREEISDEITELRTHIDRVERDAVEQFNEHMATVLEILDYENIERIWIERKQEATSQGRRTVEESVFDLHVIRRSENGATYEDSIDHLSESEREVTGLVFALAGYLAHDVHETCPFLLLDSIEAIDSERIASLIEYVVDYAEYVLVALLPEDAQTLDDEHSRITEV
jgi:chromosome segregation ATPase